jgi:hypothetical protein
MTGKKKGSKKKEERTCTYQREEYKPCGRPLYDDEHCIFHSKDIEGKNDKFNDAFCKEFERQKEHEDTYNFSGFIFPGERLFDEENFEKDVNFNYAEFFGKADFSNAQFSGMVDFVGAQFSGKVNFSESTFAGVKLTGLFDSLRNKGIKRVVKGRYKIRDFRFHFSEKIARAYPVIDRMTKDAWYLADFKANYPVIYRIWWLFADCGRSFFRWAMWSLIFALYFAGNFWLIDYAFPTAFSFDTAIQDRSLWSFIYYSVVTFTTLGFGDIIPTLVWVQRWVMAEVIMGYIMLGGLISILANKLARRS